MNSIQRCMAGVTGLAALWSGLLAATGRGQDPSMKAKLPYQALHVFQRQCLDCHGDVAKGGVRILDHTLLVKERQVIQPGSPETSELFDLVQGGSMPPGNRPKLSQEDLAILEAWIRAGAEALPSTHDESYVLWSIVRDLPKLNEKEKRTARYFSLNHLLARENSLRQISEQRESLQRTLRKLVAKSKQAPSLQPIELTGTVFRIDLADLGWDRRLYPEDKRWGRLNLFDLILLEYPDGRLPTQSPFYADLLPFLLLLQESGQVRPIPYVRADWLTAVMAQPQSPLHQEFLSLLGRPDNKPTQNAATPTHPSGGDKIVAETQVEERPEARGLKRGASPHTTMNRHVPGGGEKERFVLRNEPLVELFDRGPKGGIAIVPLDGLGYANHTSSDPLFTVEFRTVDFNDLNTAKRENRQPDAKLVFLDGEKLGFWLKASEPVRVELCNPDKKFIFPPASFDARKGIALSKIPITMNLQDKKLQKVTESFALFAYPEESLKNADSDFPAGALLCADGLRPRIVHPFFELLPNGQVKQPDPSKIVKVTLFVTTCRPDARPD